MKRILVVDDHPLFREGLKAILRRDLAFELAGEAGTAQAALALAKIARPDLVIADVSLPDKNGIQMVRELKAMLPGLGVLMVSMHAKVDYIVEAFRAGALGYLTKESAGEKLLAALKSVAAGEFYLDPSVSKEVTRKLLDIGPGPGAAAADPEAGGYDALTSREREVMRLVVEGLSTKEIAEALAISAKTVEHHRSAIMKKLGLQNAVELVRYAARIGLIDS